MLSGIDLLGCLAPDTGRLENRLWCYFAPGVVLEDAPGRGSGPEITFTPTELRAAIQDGRFDAALHIAIKAWSF